MGQAPDMTTLQHRPTWSPVCRLLRASCSFWFLSTCCRLSTDATPAGIVLAKSTAGVSGFSGTQLAKQLKTQ